MTIDIDSLSKKLINLLVQRRERGNLVTVCGGLAVLIGMTLPAFLKIYAQSTSYISSFEYMYMYVTAGIGYTSAAIALVITALTAAAAVILKSSAVISGVGAAVFLGDFLSLWSLHLPFALIGFGSFIIFAGLAAICAGHFIRR